MQVLNIGQAARRSGVSAKMIRHYEKIGLLHRVGRTESGYRVYSQQDLHSLSFIKQARKLGFPIEQIRDLLNLWQNRQRSSRKVKELALNHLHTLDQRILELQAIRETISHLATHCQGDDRPDCPILEGLAEVPNDVTTDSVENNSDNQKHSRNLLNH